MTPSTSRLIHVILCFLLWLSPTAAEEESVCRESDLSRPSSIGSLRPHHLAEPVVFSDFARNGSVTLGNGKEVEVAIGSVRQINKVLAAVGNTAATEFSVLPGTLSRQSVDNLLAILEEYTYFDEDPDTVDGMPTYEIFVDSPGLYARSNKVRDSDPNFVPHRVQMRDQIQSILRPVLDSILTPYVQQMTVCRDKSPDRACTPCYSLIRRYRHGDRVSHATHHDGHAIVTAVVSLSDYDREYRGGLYVGTGHGQREFLALNRGDAVIHQSTLLHGVQVYDVLTDPKKTHRWSWILWYRDSPQCEDHSHEWFADCALRGDAHCQQLHATKVPSIPHMSQDRAAAAVLDWNQRAARGGAGMAAVKVARAYLHQLPSNLPFDMERAAEYYQMAIESYHPDGHYGMAAILLQLARIEQQRQIHGNQVNYNTHPKVVEAVQHLEAAARLHHAYSQFNLGMVHTYGYATDAINGTIAAMWFERSGLPEGYFVAAQQAKAVGNRERYQALGERAQALGFTAPWRVEAREATGSGGAAGVSLNLPWPTAKDGRKPPKL